MPRLILCTVFCLFVGITNYIGIVDSAQDDNYLVVKTERPIIGVLSQEIAMELDRIWPGAYDSYIAASYIKFVECGGARAVPIWIGKPRSYYEIMLKKLNGIILPGSTIWFNPRHGYSDAGAYIYDIAKQMNDNGTYFPLYGTCIGFELLLYNSISHLENLSQRKFRSFCSGQSISLPLNLTDDFRNSRMFESAPQHIIDILKNDPVTPNFHSKCATQKDMIDHDLDKQWKVLSTNRDSNGLEFISTLEHKRYPFFALQYHPEKNLYDWVRNHNIPHTSSAVATSQYFAWFFVNECRKNNNSFGKLNEENKFLIYNFPVTFTGLMNTVFYQTYLFKSDADYPNELNKRDNYQ